MKKLISLILAMTCAAFAVVAVPTEVDAAFSCTNDTINQANAQIVAAQNAYAAAQADEAACKAAFEAVKAEGPSSLNYQVKANAYTSAINRTKYAYDQITNAKAFLANIQGRATIEDDYLNAVSALGVQGNLQQALSDAQAAQDIANFAAAQIKMVQTQIAGYQQQLAVSPGLQTQIDALNAQLVTLNADYAAKQAVADQKKAAAAAAATAFSGVSYDKKYIDYVWNRERYRDDPKCTCYDLYTDGCHCTQDCKENSCGCRQ